MDYLQFRVEDPTAVPAEKQQGRNSGGLVGGESRAETGEAAVPSPSPLTQNRARDPKLSNPTAINASILMTLDRPRVALIPGLPFITYLLLQHVNTG